MIDGWPLEQLIVLTKKFREMTYRRRLTRRRKTVENMSGALDSVQIPESKVQTDNDGSCVLRKRKCVEAVGWYLERNGCARFCDKGV